jgi:putative FmdB family regulatory protein
MPVYDYLCERCGPFTLMRPMAESSLPSKCPSCAAAAPRAFLTAPYCSTVSAQTRAAHAANERSANAPRTLSSLKGSHGGGCACCSGATSRRVNKGSKGSKSFPNSRPWMISH